MQKPLKCSSTLKSGYVKCHLTQQIYSLYILSVASACLIIKYVFLFQLLFPLTPRYQYKPVLHFDIWATKGQSLDTVCKRPCKIQVLCWMSSNRRSHLSCQIPGWVGISGELNEKSESNFMYPILHFLNLNCPSPFDRNAQIEIFSFSGLVFHERAQKMNSWNLSSWLQME